MPTLYTLFYGRNSEHDVPEHRGALVLDVSDELVLLRRALLFGTLPRGLSARPAAAPPLQLDHEGAPLQTGAPDRHVGAGLHKQLLLQQLVSSVHGRIC